MYKKMFGDAPVIFPIVMCLFAMAVLWAAYGQFTSTAYEGKMLVSHDQYETFKSAAINPEFTISKLQVMNSDPVYLDFSVRVPRSATFPLGENIEWQFNLMGSLMAVVGLFICSIPFWAFKIGEND